METHLRPSVLTGRASYHGRAVVVVLVAWLPGLEAAPAEPMVTSRTGHAMENLSWSEGMEKGGQGTWGLFQLPLVSIFPSPAKYTLPNTVNLKPGWRSPGDAWGRRVRVRAVDLFSFHSELVFPPCCPASPTPCSQSPLDPSLLQTPLILLDWRLAAGAAFGDELGQVLALGLHAHAVIVAAIIHPLRHVATAGRIVCLGEEV